MHFATCTLSRVCDAISCNIMQWNIGEALHAVVINGTCIASVFVCVSLERTVFSRLASLLQIDLRGLGGVCLTAVSLDKKKRAASESAPLTYCHRSLAVEGPGPAAEPFHFVCLKITTPKKRREGRKTPPRSSLCMQPPTAEHTSLSDCRPIPRQPQRWHPP